MIIFVFYARIDSMQRCFHKSSVTRVGISSLDIGSLTDCFVLLGKAFEPQLFMPNAKTKTNED